MVMVKFITSQSNCELHVYEITTQSSSNNPNSVVEEGANGGGGRGGGISTIWLIPEPMPQCERQTNTQTGLPALWPG